MKAPRKAQAQKAAHWLNPGDSTSLLEQSLEWKRWEDKYSHNLEKATAIPLARQTLWVIENQREAEATQVRIFKNLPAPCKRLKVSTDSWDKLDIQFMYKLPYKSLCYPTMQCLKRKNTARKKQDLMSNTQGCPAAVIKCFAEASLGQILFLTSLSEPNATNMYPTFFFAPMTIQRDTGFTHFMLLHLEPNLLVLILKVKYNIVYALRDIFFYLKVSPISGKVKRHHHNCRLPLKHSKYEQ